MHWEKGKKIADPKEGGGERGPLPSKVKGDTQTWGKREDLSSRGGVPPNSGGKGPLLFERRNIAQKKVRGSKGGGKKKRELLRDLKLSPSIKKKEPK